MMERLGEEFACNFSKRGEVGASLSIWHDGEQALELYAGEARHGMPWAQDTLVPIFSATKPAAALCVLLALRAKGLTPDCEMGELWKKFPAPSVTVGQLLSHQAGLAYFDATVSLLDLEACRAVIESTKPAFAPPIHAYHPHSYGPLLDLLMLELDGQRVGAFWEEHIRAPHGLEFYIGLPDSEFERVAHLRAPRLKAGMPQDEFYRAYFTAGSEVQRAFTSVTGFSSVREMNTPAAWQCGSPAKGGVASARGLAQFYQLLMHQVPAEVLSWMSTPLCEGWDRTLLLESSFACGTMCAPHQYFSHYGEQGFGHAGAGGCHAFCLPQQGLSFAYVMNQMDFGVLPSEKLLSLLRAWDKA